MRDDEGAGEGPDSPSDEEQSADDALPSDEEPSTPSEPTDADPPGPTDQRRSSDDGTAAPTGPTAPRGHPDDAPSGSDTPRGNAGSQPQHDAGSPPQHGAGGQPGHGGVPPSGRGGTGQSGHSGPAEQEDGPGWWIYLYDLVSSVAIVLIIGGLLFTASGVWPPMVAIESPSMEPTMERGDLVYVMEADRFPGDGAHEGTGVVTAEMGRQTGYQKFGDHGDVIVFEPDGNERKTPIIHRAMLWVEEDERWVDRANPRFLKGADSCDDLPNDLCPAPHSGFITKGDNNPSYDQVSGIVREGPVKPEWVIGTAELHVPYLGQIRLNSAGASDPVDSANVSANVTRENATAASTGT